MARMGRPPIFPNVAAFEACNPDGFFEWCKANEHIPLWEWFAVYMHCSRDVILDYMKKDGMCDDGSYDEQQDFRPIIKRIGTQIMAQLVEMGLTTTLKHDALTIFYMKNYDYTDKQEVDSNMTVKLVVNGGEDLAD